MNNTKKKKNYSLFIGNPNLTKYCEFLFARSWNATFVVKKMVTFMEYICLMCQHGFNGS